MQFLGNYRIDDYLAFGVQLHRFSSGAVYAPTGDVTYTFYENNSTSGAPTGGNLGQLNSKTGLYTARVQLTTANGFEADKQYFIHVEATVDSVAAGELLMFNTISEPTLASLDALLDKIPMSDGSVSFNSTVLAAIADAYLDRDMSVGTDSGSATVRTPRQALRFLRNKWTLTGDTLSVKKENDATESWSATVAHDASAEPITECDPAST